MDQSQESILLIMGELGCFVLYDYINNDSFRILHPRPLSQANINWNSGLGK